MAKNNPRTTVPLGARRPGEGTLIDVRVKPVDTGGPGTFAVEINLTAAPVPDRRYIADRADAFIRNGMVHILAGQEKITGNALRSLLVIEMGREALSMFLGSVEALPRPSIKELMDVGNARGEELRPIEDEPEQTIAFIANMVSTAFTSQEACLDFYQASAASMAAAQHRQKLAVDPVVRVEMRLALADALLEKLRQIAAYQ